MIAGIIPGHDPAIVVLDSAGGIRSLPSPSRQVETAKGVRHYIDADLLVALFEQHGIERVVVERAGVLADPDAAHSLGFAAGLIEGVLATMAIERHTVSRRDWREDLSIPADYWAAVARVNDLTRRHWPAWRPGASYTGHRKQLAALLALHAVQCSHGEMQARAA